MTAPRALDALDRALVLATQGGLPIVPHPYAEVARQLGVSEDIVLARLQALKDDGIVRRVAAVPNHYKIGYVHNAMTVWDIDDAQIPEAGRRVAALEAVSHCYHRPRHLPLWNYNLFAMVHGRDADELARHIDQVREVLGTDVRDAAVLRSTRILKKTGLRLRAARSGDA